MALMLLVRASTSSSTLSLQLRNHLFSPQTLTTNSTLSPLHCRFAHSRSRGLRLPGHQQPDPSSSSSPKTVPDDDQDNKKSRNELKREARLAVRLGTDLASFSAPQIKRILKVASLESDVYEAIMLAKKLNHDAREGRRRQFSYIGKLLRDAQPDLLEALIQATKEGDHVRFQTLASSVASIDKSDEEESYEYESEVEDEDSDGHLVLANKWYDGLLNKDSQISKEVYSIDDVEFDRQRKCYYEVVRVKRSAFLSPAANVADVKAAVKKEELRRLVRNVHFAQDRLVGGDEEKKKTAEVMTAKRSLNRFLCSLAKHLSVTQSVLI